ncbi:MAG: helix-turn-helix domain-containing protein, partial [Verrucomicrobiae bacterium]|nr:helix-turn-helix domain-containing protein [Verrucomicrobiae bacterium]
NLLLDSSLSIKEIATRVGYARQHEFNRMFNRYMGMAPSHWRSDPLSRIKES